MCFRLFCTREWAYDLSSDFDVLVLYFESAVIEPKREYRESIVVSGSCRNCSRIEFSGTVMSVMPEEVFYCPGVEMVKPPPLPLWPT